MANDGDRVVRGCVVDQHHLDFAGLMADRIQAGANPGRTVVRDDHDEGGRAREVHGPTNTVTVALCKSMMSNAVSSR